MSDGISVSRRLGALALMQVVMACSETAEVPSAPGGTSAGVPAATTSAGGGGGTAGESAHGGGGSGGAGGEPTPPVCSVAEGQLDAQDECARVELPETISLVEKWHFPPSGAGTGPAFVANLTDDNADGKIDLCDVPDVLACHPVSPEIPFELVILSGADGSVVRVLPDVDACNLAIADLNADGTPEIIALDRQGALRALSPTGALVWEAAEPVFVPAVDRQDPVQGIPDAVLSRSEPAVHDLDADGEPEIIAGLSVFYSDGSLRFKELYQATEFAAVTPSPWPLTAFAPVQPTVADFDGDKSANVLFGHVAYSADGAELWRLPPEMGTAHAHPGDFDGDGVVEILLLSRDGVSLVSAEGAPLWGPVRPPDGGVPPRYDCWIHPAALADMNGDGLPEALVNSCEHRMVLEVTPSSLVVLRSEPVPLTTVFGAPWSGSTAYDFRGSGPDWLAYHHQALTLFDGVGPSAMSAVTFYSFGGESFPRVADVDNDGSADVIVDNDARIVVYEDALRRPSPARRIWNQRNYWSTHVREDAVIVRYPQAPWQSHESYRVQQPRACTRPSR
jgi:hypothetical protein